MDGEVCSYLKWSELVVRSGVVLLALAEHVHVALAEADFSLVRLKAADQILVEAHAWVFLRHLLLHWLVVIMGWLLLHLLLLLLLFCWSGAVAATASHHGTDALMSDL